MSTVLLHDNYVLVRSDKWSELKDHIDAKFEELRRHLDTQLEAKFSALSMLMTQQSSPPLNTAPVVELDQMDVCLTTESSDCGPSTTTDEIVMSDSDGAGQPAISIKDCEQRLKDVRKVQDSTIKAYGSMLRTIHKEVFGKRDAFDLLNIVQNMERVIEALRGVKKPKAKLTLLVLVLEAMKTGNEYDKVIGMLRQSVEAVDKTDDVAPQPGGITWDVLLQRTQELRSMAAYAMDNAGPSLSKDQMTILKRYVCALLYTTLKPRGLKDMMDVKLRNYAPETESHVDLEQKKLVFVNVLPSGARKVATEALCEDAVAALTKWSLANPTDYIFCKKHGTAMSQAHLNSFLQATFGDGVSVNSIKDAYAATKKTTKDKVAKMQEHGIKKQTAVTQFMKRYFPDLQLEKSIGGRRIDMYQEFEHVHLAIEVDENQHSAYAKDDEIERVHNLLDALDTSADIRGAPRKGLVIVRFNPDAYTDGEGLVHESPWTKHPDDSHGLYRLRPELMTAWFERLDCLRQTANTCIKAENHAAAVVVQRLFFNE